MLLIKPFLGCNLACKYCYEGDYRTKAKPKLNHNLKIVLKRMEEFKNNRMTLHGGEPLVLPKKDVDKFLKKIVKLTGQSGIQTNGTLIDDDYIKMFKKYKTHVGISYDGPEELSDFRPGTAHIDKVIKKLTEQGISVSTIMVISKANAGTDKRLKKLKDYILSLEKIKVCGRLNPCLGAPAYELSEKRLIKVYLELAKFCLENNLKWSPFVDIVRGLQGKTRVCTFMGCDAFHTSSATVIAGDGTVTNCMRTNQESLLLTRHPAERNTRSEILKEIAQEFGGCKGCEYWTACYGGCPSGAINSDWRNRTYLCSLWKILFQYFENILRFSDCSSILPETNRKSCGPENHGRPGPNMKRKDQNCGQHKDSHSNTPHIDIVKKSN